MSDKINQRLRMVNLIGAAAIICGVALPAGFGVTTLYGLGRKSEANTAQLRGKLAELDGLSNTLDQVEAQKKQTESRLSQAESRLPTSNAMDQFLHELAKVAEDAGLRVDATVPGKEVQDAGGYQAKPVTISGLGDWDTSYKFLTGLRKMNRLTRLDSLVLELDKTHNSGDTNPAAALERPLCRMSITISTFMAR